MEVTHVKNLGKVRCSYGVVRKIRMLLNNHHLRILFYSMVQSHVDYCFNTWCHGNKMIFQKIQKLVNKFISMMHPDHMNNTNCLILNIKQSKIKFIANLCFVTLAINCLKYSRISSQLEVSAKCN